MNQKLSFALALLMLASAVVSCSTPEPAVNETDTVTDTTVTTAAPEWTYTFRQDWSGEAVRILNYEDPFSMHSKITTDAENGEVLNDTMYQRMLAMEDKMGVTIEETNVAYNQYLGYARSNLAAADDLFDFMYVNEQNLYALTKEEFLTKLRDLKNLQMNEESIEMLDIILRSGVPALNFIYSIGSDMIDKIGENILKGKTDVSSTIASSASKLEKALAELNEET